MFLWFHSRIRARTRWWTVANGWLFGLCLLLFAVNLFAQSSRPGMGATPYAGGVTFRVWAPNASSVTVRGDFNAWGQTALISEGNGNWSVDVAGASAGQQYKYFLNGGLWKNDPRARRVTSSVGNSIIYNPNAFDWGTNTFSTPWRNDTVIYQMHVGTFEGGTPPRTFDHAIARLDYLQSLGINAIKVMPINEFPGGRSWGYNPSNLFAIESDYGSADAFKRFVKAAHDRGIGVIVDVVHNHYGPSDLDLWQFDGWSQNGLGGIYFYNDDRAHTPWGSTRPDFGRSEVRQFIRDQIFMFLEEYRVDGFRWDSVHNILNTDQGANTQGRQLLNDINTEMQQSYPDKLRIAEDHAFDFNINFHSQWDVNYRWGLHGLVTAGSDGDRNMNTLAGLLSNWAGHHRVVFSEAHDYVGRLNNRSRLPTEITPTDPTSIWARKRSLLAAGIVMTTPGIPMIFQGQEMLETLAFHDDTALRWVRTNTYAGIVQAYADLIHSRRNLRDGMQGLKGTGINVHHIDNSNKVVAFIRWDAGGGADDVVVVANFSATRFTNTNYQIQFPTTGRWHSHFNSDSNAYQPDFDNIGAEFVDATGSPPRAAVNMGMYSLQIFSKTPPGQPPPPPPPPTPSGATFDPPSPTGCVPVTITYTTGTGPLQSASQVFIHIGRNGWQDVTDPAMTAVGSNQWQYVYAMPTNTFEINAVFHDGAGTWDNNNQQDWQLAVTSCAEPPVTSDPAEPVGCVPVTITYNAAGRLLAGASQVYIHIGRNGWQDVITPSPAMTALGDNRWQFTYNTPAHTVELDFVFHNGAGTWDNNNALDWAIPVTGCEAIPPGPPAKIAFASLPQTIGLGFTSDVVTVELRDAADAVTTSEGATVINLASDKPGTFRNAGNSANISSVTIGAGESSASFRYTSTTLGTHALSASHASLTGATQNLTVTTQARIAFDQTTTFTVPDGVTEITVEAWGGGGGPRNDGTTRRGGGGGGAYARSTIAVTPGNVHSVVVGQGGAVAHSGETGNSGGSSYVALGSQTNVLARGGNGGTNNGGAGGSAATSIGTVRFAGGSGGNRGSFTGGAGGGSAFTNANGVAGQNGPSTGHATGGAGTGKGGDGGANVFPGQPGAVPGGGGGGRGTNGGNGGAGASGRVIITYEIPVNPWQMDSNSDGIPDGWYLQFGLDPNDPSIADVDNDGDGFNNRQEYLLGTDPTDSSSVFAIISITRDGNGHAHVTWRSVGGRTYRVERSDDLTTGYNPATTITETAVATGVPTTRTFVDESAPPATGLRSYRIGLVIE